MTMTLVETIEVGAGGAASIEFTSIPQDGVDLLLVHSCRSTRTNEWNYVLAQFNSSTSGYKDKILMGQGTTASSSGTQSGYASLFAGNMPSNGATANTFGNSSIYISNYTSSTTKSVSGDGVMENNGTQGGLSISASTWSGTAAITSIKLLDYNGTNFMQYSTASLYKITKA